MNSLEIRPRALDLLNWANLQKHVQIGNITERFHPSLALAIYNYSPQVQYDEKLWDNETELSRGLIIDYINKDVIARPFRKFFNLNTPYRPETSSQIVRKTSPQITEKMDGSLGIYYSFRGFEGIATRGSFESEQAKWATKWYLLHAELRKKAGSPIIWPECWTPLFEIIYPENRIVVKYDYEGLVLIGMVNKHTGEELPAEQLRKWGDRNDIRSVAWYSDIPVNDAKDNREGYVLTWFDPYVKVKVKFDEYCRLHRVLTQMNRKTVWEMLRDGKDAELDALIGDESLPADFVEWLSTEVGTLGHQYLVIKNEAARAVESKPNGTRKEIAEFFFKRTYTHMGTVSVAFAMLDGYEYDDIIWKMLKPKATKPFRSEGE